MKVSPPERDMTGSLVIRQSILLVAPCVIAPYLELRQSENPVHGHSDACQVFLLFREQLREPLVSAARAKQVFH